jgi:RNA polymerase-binding transcription factor DksA
MPNIRIVTNWKHNDDRIGTTMFNQAKLQHWREVLLKLRDRLDANSAQIRAEATHASGGESAGGFSNMPTHLGDAGSQEAEEAVTFGMAENEATLVREVEDALARIREHRFGACEECDKRIPKTRLTALPYARHCLACAEKRAPSKKAS